MLMLMALAAIAPSTEGSRPPERARTNLSSYFSTEDYPMTAASRGIEGTARFKLDIDPDGRVSRCTITASSGDAALDAATCSVLLSRAEYTPARDRRGRAIAGTDSGSVTWRMPAPEPEPFASVPAPVRIEVTLGTDAEGRPTCLALLNGGAAGEDGELMCDMLSGPDAPDYFDGAPAGTAVTWGFAIGLEGEAAPAVERDLGRLVAASTAEFRVDAEGKVSDCRRVESDVQGDLAPLSLCGRPGFAMPVFPPAPAGSPPRRGIIRGEIHLRLGEPRPG